MTYTRDPRVDAYIDALSGCQQGTCRDVRDLVYAADREFTPPTEKLPRPLSAPTVRTSCCGATFAPYWLHGITSMCFSTTAPSSPIPSELSQRATPTRPLARSQFARVKPSSRPLSRRCSSRSSRTAAWEAGAS